MIDKNAIKSKVKAADKLTESVNIRISGRVSKFLKEQDISPTGLFYEALKEIGFKDN